MLPWKIINSSYLVLECMKLVFERMKIVVEPSSVVTLAALFEEKVDFKGKRIGLIFSVGNVDLKKLHCHP